MARVTVEDCILHVPNRFDLVLLSAQRAKQISSGSPLTVDRDNDKDAVVALREIADKTVSLDDLQETLVQSFFKKPISDIADRKLLTKGDEIPSEIEEAFKDAAQHITPQGASSSEDDAGDAAVEGADTPDGMSFEGEDVQADD